MKKADHIERCIAKLIDFLIVGIVISTVHSIFGVMAGVVYILISDGMFDGQSVGKKIMGLSVKVLQADGGRRQCAVKDSIVRNLPYGLIIFLSPIPILGIFFVLVGVLFASFETYFILFDDKGIRVGDIYAETQVQSGKLLE